MAISWPTIIVGAIIQLVVAYVSVRLALSRFRSEKWWEKRYEAYVEILLALHSAKKEFSASYEILILNKSPTDEQIKDWRETLKMSSASLMKHADMADFLISSRAVKILKTYGDGTVSASHPGQDYDEYLTENLGVVTTALSDFRIEAKRDLRGRPAIFL